MILNNIQAIQPNELFDPSNFSTGQLFTNAIFAQGEYYDFGDVQMIILGVTESRASANNNERADIAANEIRKEFYQLYAHNPEFTILDLGNLLPSETPEESYEQLSNLLNDLILKGIPVMIIGGTQDNTYGQYLAYEGQENGIQMVNIDEKIDLHELKSNEVLNDSYLWPIVMHHSHFLQKYIHLGYQQYLVPPKTITALETLNFECVRIGEIKPNIKRVEPYLRNSDMVSFDIGAIKSSDAPGKSNQTPNGFSGEEACQIMRYAGMSDQISSLGIYEYNPSYDLNKQTAMLISQMCWYYLEGVLNRKPENPHNLESEEDFRKYTVDNEEIGSAIIFWKSKKTDRWWMELPYKKKENSFDNELIACNFEDYYNALHGEMPDRWLVAYHRLTH